MDRVFRSAEAEPNSSMEATFEASGRTEQLCGHVICMASPHPSTVVSVHGSPPQHRGTAKHNKGTSLW